MSFWKSRAVVRRLICAAAVVATTAIATPSQAAFHLWTLSEAYSNASGTLQFLELSDPTFGGQQVVQGTTLSVTNAAMTMTHNFLFPNNLPGDSLNHTFILGTAGIQAAGGPAPDFIIPNGFLFQGGGDISYFNAS